MNTKEKLTPDELKHIEELLFEKGYSAVCGVDEVGRGPLAGPVVAAAVIVPIGVQIAGVADSKKLTPLRRDQVFDEIVDLGLPCAVGIIDNEDIDRINIHKASLMAMRKAVMELKPSPDFVLVDGNHPVPHIGCPQLPVVGGDALCQSIAAASVIAKVTRDRIMDRMEGLYSSFSFSKHKGYPTPAHLEELRIYGPCDIHRKSYKPVADLMKEYSLV